MKPVSINYTNKQNAHEPCQFHVQPASLYLVLRWWPRLLCSLSHISVKIMNTCFRMEWEAAEW